jgi:hypothetical protein
MKKLVLCLGLLTACSKYGTVGPEPQPVPVCKDIVTEAKNLSGQMTSYFVIALANVLQNANCPADRAAGALDEKLMIYCDQNCTVEEK